MLWPVGVDSATELLRGVAAGDMPFGLAGSRGLAVGAVGEADL
ncbi:hypothetical protein [Bifidobacterium crudilactis]